MIEISDLEMVYAQGTKGTRALKNVSLRIDKGEFVVILGKSGAGKSTLIRAINGLVLPTKGQVFFNACSVTKAKPSELNAIRRDMGMIFQQFHLVSNKTVLQNVLAGRLAYSKTLPSLFGFFSKSDFEMAEKALFKVGLQDKHLSLAKHLSGGQMQRVAIARALVQKPLLLLGDEPVASLDPVSTKDILMLIKNIHQTESITVVLNMHNVELALAYADRIIGLNNGEVVFDGKTAEVSQSVLDRIYA